MKPQRVALIGAHRLDVSLGLKAGPTELHLHVAHDKMFRPSLPVCPPLELHPCQA